MQNVFPSINNDSIGRTWSIGTCGWQKKAARAVNDRNNKKINGIHTNSFIFLSLFDHIEHISILQQLSPPEREITADSHSSH